MTAVRWGLPGAPLPRLPSRPAAPATAPELRIGGLEPFTLLDFPGHLAAVLFLFGCNFDCPWCHNRQLITGVVPQRSEERSPSPPALTAAALENFLTQRRDFLDGIVVTGGEPTLSPGLPGLLRQIKAHGYKVKLDTNGSRPEMLARLLAEGLVDYLALDVKAPLSDPALYGQVCGLPAAAGAYQAAALRHSLQIVRQWADASDDREYECRTTCCPELGKSDLELIGHSLSGTRRWAWQVWRDPAGRRTAPLNAAVLGRLHPGCAERHRIGHIEIRG